MCFHYSLTLERAEIEIQLGVHFDADWSPVFHANGFSILRMPVITQQKPGNVQLFHWGLIPHWIKTRAQALNARSETIFEKPSFRSYIDSSRCLVIADGFFEWMEYKKKKYPHFIFLWDEQLFCFGGICCSWTDTDTGEHLNTFSILTTDPNPMMARIHNIKQRMPVIIHPHLYSKWLSPELLKEDVRTFFDPYPEEQMQSHTISKLITSPTLNSNVPEIRASFIYPELLALK